MNTLILKPSEDASAIKKAAELLKSGEVVALPTETVYGLGANALSCSAVEKIFSAKGRPSDNPLIVHIAKLDEIFELVEDFPPRARALADSFWPGPLTIILKKTQKIPTQVSGGLDTVAVRMPSHPIARQLISEAGLPIAAPSANISGLPSPTAFEHVLDDMQGRVAAIVDGGSCEVGVESTVISLATEVPRVLRPGGVTLEQLREVIGEVELDASVLKPLEEGAAAASPGMKYKHYSPNADITIVSGSACEFAEFVRRNKANIDAVLCFEGEEELYAPVPCVTMGRQDDAFSQTHRLFDALRELDEIGAHRVFSRDPDKDGVGLAVCNRLYRAAGFKLIKAVPLIGLTGPTGAGKSTIAGLLEQRGFAVIDCDKEARLLTGQDGGCLTQLSRAFGEDIIKNGELDRRLLAERAFADRESTELLNKIMHPHIINSTLSKAAESLKAGVPAVIDAPLLFECGIEKHCDASIVVMAPRELRLERIIKRDGISESQAKNRQAAQHGDDYYLSRADYVISNIDEHEAGAMLKNIII